MMANCFFFSSTIEDFLFSGVSVETTLGMITLCLGMGSLSMLIEGLKACRYQFLQPKAALIKMLPTERSRLLPVNNTYGLRPICRPKGEIAHKRIVIHALGMLLYIVTLVFNYLLMLSVMTFNAYFLIAAVGGAGLGYLCFGYLALPEFTAPPRFITYSEDTGNSRHLDYGATGGLIDCGVVSAEGDTRLTYGACEIGQSNNVRRRSEVTNLIPSVGSSVENESHIHCFPQRKTFDVNRELQGQPLNVNESTPTCNVVKVEVDIHPSGIESL